MLLAIMIILDNYLVNYVLQTCKGTIFFNLPNTENSRLRKVNAGWIDRSGTSEKFLPEANTVELVSMQKRKSSVSKI